MPLGNFSLGNDVSIVMVTSLGTLNIDPQFVTQFDVKPETITEKRRGLSGPSMYENSPDGYSGTITIDRANSAVDDFFARLETNYYAGQRQAAGSIIETIQEIDGSVSQYEYQGVKFILTDLGTREATKKISMTVSFNATLRVKRA